MESIIVHPKNQMELNALKITLKEMGIKFEKFHTRSAKSVQKSDFKSFPKNPTKSSKPKN